MNAPAKSEPYTCRGCGEVLRNIHCVGTHGQHSKTCTREMRFWGHVDKSAGPDKCWPWTGFLNHDGYGRTGWRPGVGRGQVGARAHRVAWELTNGPIPTGLRACHKCDNPPCCNPAHLFLGTMKENMADCKAKRRNPHGEKVKGGRNFDGAKLTEAQVLEIRSLGGTVKQQELAEKYGVTQSNIGNILKGRTWKHIP